MAQNAPTAQYCGLRMLRYIGVTSFVAQPLDSELESITPADLEEVAVAQTAALQEIFDVMPAENRERTIGFTLRAPIQVQVNVTKYSTAISAVPGWNDYMRGCTIRLEGDDQDNEIESATSIVSPYQGANGLVTATIYSDSWQLDDTVDKVLSLMLPNQYPLVFTQDRDEFFRYIGAPLVSTAYYNAVGFPFFRFYRKVVYRPMAFYIEGWYTSTLPYTPRRIKVAPLPDQDYPCQVRVSMTPPRVLSTDIDPGGDHADPGFTFPIPSGWVERILLPIALKKYSGSPLFKNASAQVQIDENYKKAIQALGNARGRSATELAGYL